MMNMAPYQRLSIPEEYFDRNRCNEQQTQHPDQSPHPLAIEPSGLRLPCVTPSQMTVRGMVLTKRWTDSN